MLLNQGLAEKHQLELQFGSYMLYHVLEHGNSSTVYQGEHMYLRQKVAVKVLNSWAANEVNSQKFWNEARLHATMRHPHIVRVLDFGMKGKQPFMVMDYAPLGTIVESAVSGELLELSAIVSYVGQIADALHYLHQRNIIHRDIKPANILLGATNEIWLSDFGIAVAAQPWNQHILQESIGTAMYVAPEQISGKPHTASDQYSLGILVYTWLCGRPPFVGSLLQVCKQHLYGSPPSLGEKAPQIVPEVERVILKALAKDPYERFGDIQEFAEALKQASSTVTWHTDPLVHVPSIPPSGYGEQRIDFSL